MNRRPTVEATFGHLARALSQRPHRNPATNSVQPRCTGTSAFMCCIVSCRGDRASRCEPRHGRPRRALSTHGLRGLAVRTDERRAATVDPPSNGSARLSASTAASPVSREVSSVGSQAKGERALATARIGAWLARREIADVLPEQDRIDACQVRGHHVNAPTRRCRRGRADDD